MKLKVSAYVFTLLCLNSGCSQRAAEYLCTEGRHTTDSSYPELVDFRLVIDYGNSSVVLCHEGTSPARCRPMQNPIFAANFLFFEESAGDFKYSFNASTGKLTYLFNFSIIEYSCVRDRLWLFGKV